MSVLAVLTGLSTSAVAADKPPVAPKKLTVEQVTAIAVVLSWRDRSVDEVTFEIWARKDGEAEWTHQGSVGSNGTEFAAKGLERATTYEFRVEAVNQRGATPAEETVSATTLE